MNKAIYSSEKKKAVSPMALRLRKELDELIKKGKSLKNMAEREYLVARDQAAIKKIKNYIKDN